MPHSPRRARGAVFALFALGALTSANLASPATAAVKVAQSTPWVVGVGDSYISGEGGRWAGNTNTGEQHVDALGPAAYDDNSTGTAEQIPNCHRSRSAEIYLGGGVGGYNLACSGAKTSTYFDGSDFKPGLDFYSDSAGHQGQALMLQNFAATHKVTMVAVSIGGNDFNFGSIVKTCVKDFVLTSSLAPAYCSRDSSVSANFTTANIASQTAAIVTAVENIRKAMANDGYADSSYSILMQDYPSPIPNGPGIRYGQSDTRQITGGCGFWNTDADWANATALPDIDNAVSTAAAKVASTETNGSGLSNIAVLELSSALNGHRLCENTVGLLEEENLSDWSNPGAMQDSEWVNQIRTTTTVGTDYAQQESLHPDYWGQLALRDCLRQAYNGGLVHGGTCTTAAAGQDNQGEPLMALLGGGIVNGSFDDGLLGSARDWTTTGTSSVTLGGGHWPNPHALELGSGTPTNGDSTASQTFTAPGSDTVLSFWYDNFCPDTVNYDWATVTLTDSTTGTTAAVLPKTCQANSGWTESFASITPFHTYTLTLVNHDDGYPGDPTYTLFDDISTGPLTFN